MTEFADISVFQHGAALSAYAAAGYDRIMIKATQGLTYTYPDFAPWWRLAGQLGLARGAYHYAQPSTANATGEADFFLSTVAAAGGFGPRDWVELDSESPSVPSPTNGQYMVALAERLVSHGRTAAVLYSGKWWLEPAHLTAAMLPAGYRQLHLSDYTTAPDATMPIPAGWDRSQVVARQYTSAASQPGIPGGSDRSRVLRDWLTPGGPDVDENTFKQWVRDVLNEARAPGTVSWSDLEGAEIGAVRTDVNLDLGEVAALGWKAGDPTIAARLGQLETDVAAIRKQLATVPAGSVDLTGVTAQLDRIEAAQKSLTLVAVESSP